MSDMIMDAVNASNYVRTEEEFNNPSSHMGEVNTSMTALQDVLDSSPSRMLNSYIQKTQPKVRKNKKVGRNDECPCGSGKKYKNCCLSSGIYEGYE